LFKHATCPFKQRHVHTINGLIALPNTLPSKKANFCFEAVTAYFNLYISPSLMFTIKGT
jgi:hypothetical protein